MPKRAEYGVNWYNWRGTYVVYRWGYADETSVAILVDTPEWFELLARVPSFNFKGKNGQFTVRKEQRRSGTFWYGFYRVAGQGVKKVYVGKTEELLMERLEEKVKALYTKIDSHVTRINLNAARPSKVEKCALCQVPFEFIRGAAIDHTNAGIFFVCQTCAFRHSSEIKFRISEYYDRFGELLQRSSV